MATPITYEELKKKTVARTTTSSPASTSQPSRPALKRLRAECDKALEAHDSAKLKTVRSELDT